MEVAQEFKVGQWVVVITDPDQNTGEIGVITNFSGDGWVAVKFDNNLAVWVKEDQLRQIGE